MVLQTFVSHVGAYWVNWYSKKKNVSAPFTCKDSVLGKASVTKR